MSSLPNRSGLFHTWWNHTSWMPSPTQSAHSWHCLAQIHALLFAISRYWGFKPSNGTKQSSKQGKEEGRGRQPVPSSSNSRQHGLPTPLVTERGRRSLVGLMAETWTRRGGKEGHEGSREICLRPWRDRLLTRCGLESGYGRNIGDQQIEDTSMGGDVWSIKSVLAKIPL